MAQRVVIAIDGPAGSGKSTVARRLATALGFRYLDSGAMYRALALKALRTGVAAADEAGLAALLAGTEIVPDGERVWLDGEDVGGAIRTVEVSRFVSPVAAVRGVRLGMVAKQRAAYPDEALVVEGRDIGSVVFPDAAAKVYLTATIEERARRRAAETGRDPREVEDDLRERDGRDMSRAESPLTVADGAWVFDTTGFTIEEVVERLAAWVRRRLRA
jgi:cytidylate kinase